MTDPIQPGELIRGLTKGNQRFRKATKSNSGVYCLRYGWEREGLPHGEQLLWLLYHPTSFEKVKEALEDVIRVARLCEGKTVLMNCDNPAEDPSRNLSLEVMLLCDGGFTTNAYEINFDGAVGFIGVICGQGRELSEDARNLATYTLGQLGSQASFVLKCREKLEKIVEALKTIKAEATMTGPRQTTEPKEES